MLDIYEKRNVYRLIGPNQRVKLKMSAFEIIQNPVGVEAVAVLEAQTTMIRHLSNKLNEQDELLRTIYEAATGKKIVEASDGSKEQ